MLTAGGLPDAGLLASLAAIPAPGFGVAADESAITLDTPTLGSPSAATSPVATSLSNIAGTAEYGKPGTLTATLSTGSGTPLAGKIVTFKFTNNGTTTRIGAAKTDAHGVATLNGRRFSGFHAGTAAGAVTASFAGDLADVATASTGPLTISKATPRIFWNNTLHIAYGMPLGAAQLHARSNVAGRFTYAPGAGALLPVGTLQSLTVNFVPNNQTDYNNATATVMIDVIKGRPTIALSASAEPSILGKSLTFTATVSGAGVAPTGTVTFYDNGQSLPADAVTIAAGKAVLSTTALAIGTHEITAAYSGDGNYRSRTSAELMSEILGVPTVTAIGPAAGRAAGSTLVTITGTNLADVTAVNFGATAGKIITVSDTRIVAVSPAGSGTVDVTVTAPGGTSATVAADKFIYAAGDTPLVTAVSPASGAAAGGTWVTITGVNLGNVKAVYFGTTAATRLSFSSGAAATRVRAKVPAGTGTVDVTVVTAAGMSAVTAADQFTYTTATPAPAVSAAAESAADRAGLHTLDPELLAMLAGAKVGE